MVLVLAEAATVGQGLGVAAVGFTWFKAVDGDVEGSKHHKGYQTSLNQKN